MVGDTDFGSVAADDTTVYREIEEGVSRNRDRVIPKERSDGGICSTGARGSHELRTQVSSPHTRLGMT
jgi:hypothetical protein